MGAVAGVSEVGSAEVTWIGDLITKDLLLRAFERPLLLHSALKCTQLTIQEQAFHAATERMGDVEELRLEYSTNRNLASIVTDSLVANSRLPEGENVAKLRTWLPMIASSVGMALGGTRSRSRFVGPQRIRRHRVLHSRTSWGIVCRCPPAHVKTLKSRLLPALSDFLVEQVDFQRQVGLHLG